MNLNRYLFLFLFFPFMLPAQPVLFEKIFGTSRNEQARSVKELADGSVFVLGFSDSGMYGGIDASLSKLDRYGNLLWTKYYGDSADNFGLYLNKTADGNLVFCGERQSNFGAQVDAYAIKVDTSGNILWSKLYATALNESFKYVEQTADGGYIQCGFVSDNYGYNDTYVMRTNAQGDSVWAVNVGGTNNDYSDAVHELADGNFIVTGDTKSQGFGGYDVELTKLDASGQQVWDFPYGDVYNNGCQGVFLNSSGKYISFGETVIYNNSPFDFYLEQIDTAGSSEWRRTFGGTNADAIFSIVEMQDKGYFFTGYSNSYSSGPLNLVAGRTDSAGGLQWVRVYGGPGIDIGYEIIHSVDGGVIIAGSTVDSTDFTGQYYLLHLNDNGYLSGLGKYNNKEEGMILYPNPNTGSFNIYCENAGPGAGVKLYTAEGKMLYHGPLIAKNNKISLEGIIAPGVYFAEVFDGKQYHHAKVVMTGGQ